MIQEYTGTVESGMFVYILPRHKRRTPEYKDLFSGGIERYGGRAAIEGGLFRVGATNSDGSFYLNIPSSMKNAPNYCYNKADCFIFGKIALAAKCAEERFYIEELHKYFDIVTSWAYDSSTPYTLDGKFCRAIERLSFDGYTAYTVEEFKAFCYSNHIHIYLPLSKPSENENQLQGEESSLRRGDEPGKSGVCSGGHRIEFAVGHLSNKAYSVKS